MAGCSRVRRVMRNLQAPIERSRDVLTPLSPLFLCISLNFPSMSLVTSFNCVRTSNTFFYIYGDRRVVAVFLYRNVLKKIQRKAFHWFCCYYSSSIFYFTLSSFYVRYFLSVFQSKNSNSMLYLGIVFL